MAEPIRGQILPTCPWGIFSVTTSSRKPANHSVQRVIEVTRAHREVSRRVIAKETGLSTPSVTRLVNELIEAQLLTVIESTTSDGAGPGRPASVVKLDSTCACVIGVDVGEHVMQVALADMSGDMQLTSRLPTEPGISGETMTCNIITAIEEIYDRYKSSVAEVPPLRAITVAVPGTVDPVSSRVVKAPKIKGWTNFELKERLEAGQSGVAIRIVNDINAAAIGEFAHGVAKGRDNFVFASIRRGIGAGIFIDGRLYQGHAGFAGEMGKMVFDSKFEFSQSDGSGHLETICGGDPVIAQAKERGVKLDSTESRSPLNALATAAAAGDPEAVSILRLFVKQYGLAIANVASLLDPSIIVLGGDIHPAMKMVVNQLGESISGLIPSPPVVVGSSLGDQACLHGTIYQAHKDACDRLLSFQPV